MAQMYPDPTNFAFLTFLKGILKEFNSVNELFQSENANQLKLLHDLLKFYEKLVAKIVTPGRFEKVSTGQLAEFDFNKYLMPTNCMDFGYELRNLIEKSSVEAKTFVTERCKLFLIEIVTQVRNRLPVSLNVLSMVEDLALEKALSWKQPNIEKLLFEFNLPHIDLDAAKDKYQLLKRHEWSSTDDPAQFWPEVFDDKDGGGCSRFLNISSFALSVFALPFSNAAVERVFSQMNILKSKLRNRMQIKMLESVLTVRYGLVFEGTSCANFEVKPLMLAKFSVSMYENNDISC